MPSFTVRTRAACWSGVAVITGLAITVLLLTFEPDRGQEYLEHAVDRGDIVSAALLLYAGVSSNRRLQPRDVPPPEMQYVRDDGSWLYMDHTDLMQAARDGRTSLVKLLLAWKADPNVVDQAGLTALEHAAYSAPSRQLLTIDALLRRGAKLNGPQGSVLNIFSRFGEDAALKILLEHGADVNLPKRTGETALMAAARSGRCSTVQLLLAHHTDSSMRNRQGKTALELAKLSLATNAFPAPPTNTPPPSLQCVVDSLEAVTMTTSH